MGNDRDERLRRKLERQYRKGEEFQAGLPVRIPQWTWLIVWAKAHPVPGSVLQAVLFGLVGVSLVVIAAVLGVPPLLLALFAALDLGGAVYFGVAAFRYNGYVSKHCEPWA